MLTTRPEVEQANPDEEEVSIRLSVLPIRLNIDQVSHTHCICTVPLGSCRTLCTLCLSFSIRYRTPPPSTVSSTSERAHTHLHYLVHIYRPSFPGNHQQSHTHQFPAKFHSERTSVHPFLCVPAFSAHKDRLHHQVEIPYRYHGLPVECSM